MALTSEQILDLAVRRSDVGRAGNVEALRRFGVGRTNSIAPSADERLLAAVREQPAPPRTRAYAHPLQQARAAGPRQDVALTASDLLWLQRLPVDPAQVSHQDAVALAGLWLGQASSADQQGAPRAGVNASDRRLLESIWAPVRALHDRRAAEVALDQARRPHPPVPPETSDALTEAIAREVPALSPQEARRRAETNLSQALVQRDAEHAAGVEQAQRRLLDVIAAAQQMTAVGA